MKLWIVTKGDNLDTSPLVFNISYSDPAFSSSTLPFSGTTTPTTKRRLLLRYPQYVSNPQRSAITLDPALWKSLVVDECLFLLEEEEKGGGGTIKVVLVDGETKEWDMDRACEIKVRIVLASTLRAQKSGDVETRHFDATAVMEQEDTTDATMEDVDIAGRSRLPCTPTKESTVPQQDTIVYSLAKSRLLDIFHRHVLLPHLSSSSNFASSYAHWSNQSKMRQCEKDMAKVEKELLRTTERLKDLMERGPAVSAAVTSEQTPSMKVETEEEDGCVPEMSECNRQLDLDVMDIGWSLDRSILCGAKALDAMNSAVPPSPPSQPLNYSSTQPITRSKPPPPFIIPVLRRASITSATTTDNNNNSNNNNNNHNADNTFPTLPSSPSSPTLPSSPTSPSSPSLPYSPSSPSSPIFCSPLLPTSPLLPPRRSRLRNSPFRPASDIVISLQADQLKALQTRQGILAERRNRLLLELETIEQEAQMRRQREADSIELRRGTRGKPVVEPLEEDKVTNVNTSDEKAVLWNHWDDAEDLNKNLPPTPPFKARVKDSGTASPEAKEAIAEEMKTSDEASSKPSYLVVVGGKRKKDEAIVVEADDVISGESEVCQINEPPSRKVLSSKKADKEKTNLKVLTELSVKRSSKENESVRSSLNIGRMDKQRGKIRVPDTDEEDSTVKEDRQQNLFLVNGVQSESETNNMVDVKRYRLRNAMPVNKENASSRQPCEGGKKHIPTSAVTTTITVKTTVTTKVVRVGDAKRHHHHHHHRQASVSIPNATKKSIGLSKDNHSPLQNIAKYQRRSRSTLDLRESSEQRHRRNSLSSVPGAGKDDPPIMTKSRSLPTARILWYDIDNEEGQEGEDEDESQDLRPSMRQELYRDLVIATSPTKRKRGGSLSSSLAEGKTKAYKSGSEVTNDDKLREMEQYAKEGCEYESCDVEERQAGSKLEDVEMTEVECFRDAVTAETAVPLLDGTTNASVGIPRVDQQPDNQSNDGLLVRLLGPLKSSSRNRTGIAWKTLSEIEREDSMVKRVEEDDDAVDWLHRLDMRRVVKALGMV